MSMLKGIDHLVIACADPDAAAAELESALGIACTAGGRHERFGTYNRIGWLADGSYLELIGVSDADAAALSPVGAAAVRTLEAHGGGLATYALLVDDLEAAAPASFGPPTHGSRARDDGEVVEWWTAFPAGPLGPTVPFLIQHAYTGREWGEAALAERARYVHPIGSPVVLSRIDLAVADPPTLARPLEEGLGIGVRAVADLAVAQIGPHVVRLLPRREMAVPAVIVLGADVETPRVADLLGLRFDVEPVTLPVHEPNPA
jgi:hypothetical protein